MKHTIKSISCSTFYKRSVNSLLISGLIKGSSFTIRKKKKIITLIKSPHKYNKFHEKFERDNYSILAFPRKKCSLESNKEIYRILNLTGFSYEVKTKSVE